MSREKEPRKDTYINMEREIKILEIDPKKVARRLEENGAQKILDALTHMEGFDIPSETALQINVEEIPYEFRGIIFRVRKITSGGQNLISQGAYLRLREEGDRCELVLKQRLPASSKKVKLEEETAVNINKDRWEEVRDMLLSFGLRRVIFQEKKRVSYFLSPLRYDIDTWPKVPPYLEIEGPDEASILKGVSILGFAEDLATSISGKALFEKYGVDPTYLVFDEEENEHQ